MSEQARRWAVVALAVLSLAGGCDGGAEPQAAPNSSATSTTLTLPPVAPTATPTSSATPSRDPGAAGPARFRVDASLQSVRRLAGRIGPRETTSHAYARAAGWVERRFDATGYDVMRQRLSVPAGVSWGVPVDAGRTWNVIAQPADFDPFRPYRLVGAHLDTVPQAPGAEDNASGVAVLLELARLAAGRRTGLPVVFVAFAAEEPRGDGDALHHFGSRAYVARMPVEERRNLTAMVSLDRVGVGRVVPVCTGGAGPASVQAALLTTAQRTGVAALGCDNTSSDHWSFELAGLPAARVGSTPYAAYHSAADLPGVVRPAQLRRVGALMWDWLRS